MKTGQRVSLASRISGLVRPFRFQEPLYRFGFVMLPSADKPGGAVWRALERSWMETSHGDFRLLTHPHTPVARIGDAVLVGHCFSTDEQRGLDELVGAFCNGDAAALDPLSGRFALIRDGKICNDAIGSRSIFYRLAGAPAVASHDGLLARLYGEPKDALAAKIVADDCYKRRTVRYLPGDLSVHHNIRAMPPNHVYDMVTAKMSRTWPRHNRKTTTLDDFYAEADAYFDGMARFLKEGGLNPVLGLTGGTDSRCLIAALHKSDVPMALMTWATRARREEFAPIEAMVRVLGQPHTLLRRQPREKWGGSSRQDRRLPAAAEENVGHGRTAGELVIPMAQAYGDGSHVFIVGIGAGILSGYYNLRGTPLQSVTATELARLYNSGGQARSRHYRALVTEAIEGFMERASYDSLEAFGYDVNDIYHWEQRLGMWGASRLNVMDPALLTIVGFNSRRLYEAAFGLDPALRLTRDKTLMRDLTKRYNPTLAAIDVV